jgi:hypothetical protein
MKSRSTEPRESRRPATVRSPLLAVLQKKGDSAQVGLVALDVADIEETETGPLVTIRHSKTDQEGAGDIIAISPAT